MIFVVLELYYIRGVMITRHRQESAIFGESAPAKTSRCFANSFFINITLFSHLSITIFYCAVISFRQYTQL